jgi:glucosyl-dolichyl phosphate glucuronosyltransferase
MNQDNSEDIILSIAVCTYKRPELLGGCLDSLVNAAIDLPIEILIIDNNSQDETKAIADEFIQISNKFKYYLELKQGLSHARNRAIAESDGSYIAYLDDDARADDEWAAKALELISMHPKAIVLGGMIRPFYLNEKPAWFQDKYEIRTWGEDARYLTKGEAFSGSNVIFRRELIEKIGGFDSKLGVSENQLRMGEETDLQWRLQDSHGMDNTFLYSPDLIIYHWVPEYKMKLSYYMKRSIASGQSNYEMKRRGFRKNANMAINHILNLGFRGIQAVGRFFEYKSKKQWAFENLVPVMHSMGFVLRYFAIKLRFKNQ